MYQSPFSGGCAVVRGGLRDRRVEYNWAESLGLTRAEVIPGLPRRM